MGQDLVWSGASRKLGPDDSMGLVTGVRVGMGSARKRPEEAPNGAPARPTAMDRVERPGIESAQLEAPRKEPETRPNGRVRLPPV